MTRQKSWTPYEKGILTRYYPLEGAKGVKKRLNGTRSIHSIMSKARRHNIHIGNVKGMIPAVYVHPATCPTHEGAHYQVLKQAEMDGVLVIASSGRNAIKLVPIEWADAYAKRLEKKAETERRTRHWLPSTVVAERLNCHVSSLPLAVRGKRCGASLKEAISGVRCELVSGNFRWHPGDVEAAVRKYRYLQKQDAA